MIKKIKNNSQVPINISGQLINIGEYYTIQSKEDDIFFDNSSIIDLIQNESIIINNGTSDIIDKDLAISWLLSDRREKFPNTFACDLGGTNVSKSGNDWSVLSGTNILWDTSEMLDQTGSYFTIKKNGIYSLDVQIQIINSVNITAIETAVWKRLEGEDDYWFIINYTSVLAGQSIIQLTGYTQFDFRENEQYYLALKFYGTDPSGTINGNDDYTAWGISWVSPII